MIPGDAEAQARQDEAGKRKSRDAYHAEPLLPCRTRSALKR